MTAPITEDLSTTLRYNYASTTTALDVDQTADLAKPPEDRDCRSPIGIAIDGSPWVRSSVSHSMTYNTLDDRKLPRDGIYATFTQEFAGLGGDSDFYKIYGKARYFQTLTEDADIIGSLSAGAGYMLPTSGDLHVFDQFQLNANDMRGFESGGIGPRMTNGDADRRYDLLHGFGRNHVPAARSSRVMPASVAPSLPMPARFTATMSTRAGDPVNGTSMDWRASVGASLIWSSPFGPLRVDYAIPVVKEDFDEEQRFKFGISSSF